MTAGFDEFDALRDWWDAREENEFAWRMDVNEILQVDESGAVLSVNLDQKNPHAGGSVEHRPPTELAESILAKEARIATLMGEIQNLLKKGT